MCAGRTGAVTRLYKGVQRRLVTDLPSYAPEGGEGATGPHDVSVRDRAIAVTIGLGGDPTLGPTAIRAALDPDLGWLIRARRDGTWQKVADIAGYEEAANPDGGLPDSNPYGLRAGVSSRLRHGCRGERAAARVRPGSDGDAGGVSVAGARPTRPMPYPPPWRWALTARTTWVS